MNIFWSQPCSYLLSSSWRKFEEMIEPFRLYEGSKDTVQAEAMQKEQPYKITDKELNTFEDKVKQLTSPEYLEEHIYALARFVIS